MCGIKSKAYLLILVLVFLSPWALYSNSLPPWAEEMTEQEAKEALVESVTRWEIRTNEHEKALDTIDEYRMLTKNTQSLLEEREILIDDLRQTVSDRDSQLQTIGVSFDAYVARTRRVMIRNTAIGFGVGTAAGAIGVLYLYTR